MRDGHGERLLVDPESYAREAGGTPHAINWYTPSPDGRRVAFGLSAAGSEDASLRVVDTASGRILGEPIGRAEYGGVAWTADAQALYFVQLAVLAPGAAATEKYRNSRVVRLPVGGGAASLQPVLGPGTPGMAIDPAEVPFVSLSVDGRWAFATVINGVQRELRLYASPARAFLAGQARWTRLVERDDGIVAVAYARGTLYAITHRGAPRYKLIAGALAGFDAAHARTLVEPGPRVITGLAAARDALYVELRDGNVKRLARRPHLVEGRGPRGGLVDVPLPIEGGFALAADEAGLGAANPALPGLLLELQGWTQARRIVAVDAAGRARDTGLQPAGPYDRPADLVATEIECTSHDGARVPMSVIHRRGLALDGGHPTLLYGYASYGITEEPGFSTGRLAWIEAGGVAAVANPRGSGVYGEDWYRGGFQATKPNTWKDFIACAQELVARGYTRPARLGILGGSAGGILVGRALTERPDLFGAAVVAVGALDLVRAETTPNGVPNIPEFGSRQTEAGFRALLAMSTYHQIRDGVAYPAVLFTHGVNDPRVEVWESTKTAARLMAASSSGKPVLLRLDYAAGHGIGNTKAQQQAERADIYAFLLWQLDAEGAGPR